MKQRYRDFELSVEDDNNVILNRVRIAKNGDRAGQETLVLVGYFGSMAAAVKRMASLCANEAPDLKSWLAEFKNVVADIKEEILA